MHAEVVTALDIHLAELHCLRRWLVDARTITGQRLDVVLQSLPARDASRAPSTTTAGAGRSASSRAREADPAPPLHSCSRRRARRHRPRSATLRSEPSWKICRSSLSGEDWIRQTSVLRRF